MHQSVFLHSPNTTLYPLNSLPPTGLITTAHSSMTLILSILYSIVYLFGAVIKYHDPKRLTGRVYFGMQLQRELMKEITDREQTKVQPSFRKRWGEAIDALWEEGCSAWKARERKSQASRHRGRVQTLHGAAQGIFLVITGAESAGCTRKLCTRTMIKYLSVVLTNPCHRRFGSVL